VKPPAGSLSNPLAALGGWIGHASAALAGILAPGDFNAAKRDAFLFRLA
jgi:hypothetical protein